MNLETRQAQMRERVARRSLPRESRRRTEPTPLPWGPLCQWNNCGEEGKTYTVKSNDPELATDFHGKKIFPVGSTGVQRVYCREHQQEVARRGFTVVRSQ